MDYLISLAFNLFIKYTEMDPVFIVTSGFVATFILWFMFVNVMYIKNVLLKKYPDGWKYKALMTIGVPLIIIGLIYDVIFNITYGTLIFLEWPHKDRLTLSTRMTRIIENRPETWRGTLAIFFCKYLVEPWDPGHCNLWKLEKK